MSQVDWSKAPEGATHYGNKRGDWESAWYILKEETISVMLDDGKDKSWCTREIDDQDRQDLLPHLIARPWAGTGLPPVGTVCEYFAGEWKEVRITGHAELGICFREPGKGGENYVALTAQFRPMRTPEQIAAEEREKAIQQMLIGTPWPGSDISRRVCEHIYDAGYRKQEAP